MSVLMQKFAKLWLGGIAAILITACSGDIGPDESLLYGTWEQDGAAQTDPTLVVEQAVITYQPDGISTFDAIMTLTENNGIPERFSITANVLWTLEETILTRTLKDVTVTPDISTPEADALADAFENAYRESPPGRLIIDALDDTKLVVIDGDTGANLTYLRQ